MICFIVFYSQTKEAKMNGVVFEPLVGGFTTVTAGGTRNAIKLSRPWQPPLPLAQEKCPFCTKPQEEILLPGMPEGWRLLPNIFTPHRHHRLAIPKECWDSEKLQTLGGLARIREALEIFRLAIKEDRGLEMATFAHVGWSAGQNLGHMHWHIMETRIRKPFSAKQFAPELLVQHGDALDIIAAGARSGECLLVPHMEMNFDKAVEALAISLDWIVQRGNEKFRSTEGRPPEVMVAARVRAGR